MTKAMGLMVAVVLAAGCIQKQESKMAVNTTVVMETSDGAIEIELFDDKAPLSVSNFLAYAETGFYNGTIFHRVIPGFMIQCGGFEASMNQKPTKAPIKNEATNGLKNERGTLAMARTSVIDSATSQFFVNVKDNDFLNNGARDFGYAVFGKVTSGMDVVDKIAGKRTAIQYGMSDVPVIPITIKSVTRKQKK